MGSIRFRALACLVLLVSFAASQPAAKDRKDDKAAKQPTLPPGTIVAVVEKMADALGMVPGGLKVLTADGSRSMFPRTSCSGAREAERCRALVHPRGLYHERSAVKSQVWVWPRERNLPCLTEATGRPTVGLVPVEGDVMFSRALEAWGRWLGLGQPKTREEEDRRAWGRANCDIQTNARPAGGLPDDWRAARVRNISAGGIGMEMACSFTPGVLMSVALPANPEKGMPTEVLACVVRCDEMSEGRYAVGCTFAAVLPEADLALFGAKQVKAGEGDKRQWERFPCKAHAFLMPVHAERPAPVKPAVMRDISASGIAVESDADVQVGDLVQIDVVRDDETLYSTLASVVRVERGHAPARAYIGANFIGELPEEKLARIMA
jgi:hypothetical protein